MKLLNNKTWDITDFLIVNKKYAILSHCWGSEEVTFQDWENRKTKSITHLEGYTKIKSFGEQAAKTKLKVAAGPNNPVGSTWIDLSKDTYGIHGTPDPETIGKHQSHGCVRLTNWDAAELGKIIKKGAKVAFINANTAKRSVG